MPSRCKQDLQYINSEYFSGEDDQPPFYDAEILRAVKASKPPVYRKKVVQQCSEEEVQQLEREICHLIETHQIHNEQPQPPHSKGTRNTVNKKTTNSANHHMRSKSKIKNTKANSQNRQVSSQSNLCVQTSNHHQIKAESNIKQLEDQYYGHKIQLMQRNHGKWYQGPANHTGVIKKTKSKHKTQKNEDVPLPIIRTNQSIKESETKESKTAKIFAAARNDGGSFARVLAYNQDGEEPLMNISTHKQLNFAEQLKHILCRQSSKTSFNENLPVNTEISTEQSGRIPPSYREQQFNDYEPNKCFAQAVHSSMIQSIISNESIKNAACKDLLLNRPVRDPRMQALQRVDNRSHQKQELLRSQSKLLVIRDSQTQLSQPIKEKASLRRSLKLPIAQQNTQKQFMAL